MKRVLHIVCFPELYGTQRSALSTVKCLDREKFEPFVSAPPRPEFEAEVRAAGAGFIPVPMNGLFDFGSAMLLRREMRRLKIDIIHCHLGISSFLGLLAARPLGIPAVVSRHFIADRYTTITNPALYRLYLYIYRWMNARFYRIICVSGAVRDALMEREGAPPGRCVVVHNGVALEGRPAPSASKKPFAHPEIPSSALPPGRKVVVTLSRLVPEKGLETLIKAVAVCANDQGIDLALIIAGDGPLIGDLRQLASDLGVEDRVFMPGFLHDTPALLASADLFVLPALAEPFGIALLEAMAAGLPSVASASGGPLEIIRHEHSGLLVPPGDAPALARAVSRVLAQPDFASSLSRTALDDVRNFDEITMTKKIEAIYTEALNDKGYRPQATEKEHKPNRAR